MTERIYRVRCHGQMLYHGDNLDVAMSVYNRMRAEHDGQHQPTLDEAEWHEIKRPMWRSRQRIKLLDTPLECEMDDQEPNYTEVDFVPYQESCRAGRAEKVTDPNDA